VLTTAVGQSVDDLDTPVLLVDLDAMDRNIAGIAAALAARGVAWRPHVKAHTCPAIVHRQLAAGAIGVTCAKLGEAEVMAAAGVRDLLIANQIVGPIKTRRLAALRASGQADPIVAVDALANVRELDDAVRAGGGPPLRVVVEVDTGMGRCGVAPGAATVALASEMTGCAGLRFAGVMGWEGHAVGVADADARRAAVETAIGILTASAAACREAGLPVEIVSCGGSGTYLTAAAQPGVTEIQAGGASLGGAWYRDRGAPVETALTLLVGVVSRPAPDRIVVDAGRKAVDPTASPPVPRALDGFVDIKLSAEHGTIQLDRAAAVPAVGDRLALEIGYHDQAVHLHEALYAVRDGRVVAVWPVERRGRLR